MVSLEAKPAAPPIKKVTTTRDMLSYGLSLFTVLFLNISLKITPKIMGLFQKARKNWLQLKIPIKIYQRIKLIDQLDIHRYTNV